MEHGLVENAQWPGSFFLMKDAHTYNGHGERVRVRMWSDTWGVGDTHDLFMDGMYEENGLHCVAPVNFVGIESSHGPAWAFWSGVEFHSYLLVRDGLYPGISGRALGAYDDFALRTIYLGVHFQQQNLNVDLLDWSDDAREILCCLPDPYDLGVGRPGQQELPHQGRGPYRRVPPRIR